MTALLSTERTTTSIPRVVGEPLDWWIVAAAGLALLLAIVVASVVARRRMRGQR